jgi:CHAD domain-containing protein
MKTEDIIQVYKARLEKISRYFHNLLKDFAPDDNHFFRVEIKKLRAFIRLANLTDPDHPHKIPKAIKKFYHAIGDIRNLQLLQQRISSLSEDLLIGKPSGYVQYLHNREKLMRGRARRIAKKISFKDFEKELVDRTSGELTEEIKNTFVQKSKYRLEQLLSLAFFYDETLHDMRKVIKDIMYTYKYLEPAVSIVLPAVLNELEAMKTLTGALGDFHDLAVALLFLSTACPAQILQANETAKLNELKTHLQLRKENMKSRVVNSLLLIQKQIESGGQRQTAET